ncbi:hypothetical protein ACQP0U_18715 [Micromonospora sp. CA-269861]|uniref:hypothetical protein n=1 Tax=Micromonospora sp. CA-269861 TaxID=3239968 RepID=UPI003D8C0538
MVIRWAAESPDLPAVAGYYSQLAGVLAGFGFAGVVGLVTTQLAARNAAATVVRSLGPLVSAFIGLVAASLDYALVAGEPIGSARVASLQTVAGMGFSIAGAMLMYAIYILLCDLQHDAPQGRPLSIAAIGFLRSIIVSYLPTVLVLLMWSGVRDHLESLKGQAAFYGWPDWVAIGALGTTLLAAFLLRSFFGRQSPSRFDTATKVSRLATQLSFASLLGSAALITFTETSTAVPTAIPVIALVLVAAFSVVTAYFASRYFGEPDAVNADAVAPVDNMHAAADSGSGVTSTSAKSKRILQPLDQQILRLRSIEIFPQGYLMNISIIQGVALSVLVVETVNTLRRDNDPLPMVPTLAQSSLTLACLIIVSYEYLWFSTIMRWTPTFRDTAIPVVLGVGEIVPPLLLGNSRAWWIATGAFALLGAMAFVNTATRSDPDMFPQSEWAYKAIRGLLLTLAAASLATAVLSGVIAYLIGRVSSEQVLSTAGALLILLTTALFVVGRSERILNDVYDQHGVGRRPPLYERLRQAGARLRDRTDVSKPPNPPG